MQSQALCEKAQGVDQTTLPGLLLFASPAGFQLHFLVVLLLLSAQAAFGGIAVFCSFPQESVKLAPDTKQVGRSHRVKSR